MQWRCRLGEITLDEFDSWIVEIADIKKHKEELEKQIDALNEKMKVIENKAMLVLEESGRTSYKHPLGTLILTTKWNWKNPTDPVKKKEFLTYLEKEGLRDKMTSVNHQTLNSYCREQMEFAQQSGNIDFAIPGIDPPTVFKQISLRKASA